MASGTIASLAAGGDVKAVVIAGIIAGLAVPLG